MRCKREADSAYPSSTCGVKLRPCYHISMIQYYFSVCDRLFCAVGIMFFVCVCLCVSLFTSTLRILVQHLSWSCRWPWPQKDRSLFLSTRSGKPPPFPGVCGGLCSSNFLNQGRHQLMFVTSFFLRHDFIRWIMTLRTYYQVSSDVFFDFLWK